MSLNGKQIKNNTISIDKIKSVNAYSADNILSTDGSEFKWISSSTSGTPITYSELKALKTNNTLSPGVRYYITDRDIWIDALDTDKLAMECKRHFRIVKDEYYTPHTVTTYLTINYLGIYGQTIQRGSVPNSSSAVGGNRYFAIWGGRMWQRNTSGLDDPGTSNETIAGGWTLQSTASNTYYESKIFDIKYNFDDDIIWEQSDDRGNIIRRENSTISYIDITDWGSTKIYNNQCYGIFNNSNNGSIFNNPNYGSIYNNSNNGDITFNSNIGDIWNNSNDGDISNNSNIGNINENINDWYIRYNSNIGHITNNSNSGYILNNSNIGYINDNSNIGYINDNSNSGSIIGNSNNGNIQYNSNNGYINNNSNNGNIQNNLNNGYIRYNSNTSGTTHIRYNTNTGYIGRNSMNGSYLLEYNNNNGSIGPASGSPITRNADITDTIVNKP